MKRRAVLATMLLCRLPATAQTPKAKKAPPIPPPLPPMPYVLEDAFGGLRFSQPLAIGSAPGENQRLFVVEKTGAIQIVTRLDQAEPSRQLFLDLLERPEGKLDDKSECGLLGLAFHPGFARNGRFFACYSLRIGGVLHQRVAEFRAGPDQSSPAIAASERPLITQRDPAGNHNGGDLHFGPDGFLYFSVGDGGGANDIFDTGRFINKDFHAAIFRIDVDKRPGSLPPNPHPAIGRDADGTARYAVPADNPFLGATSHRGMPVDPATIRTEIWATGLRNAWRFSFDPPTGRLFAGDVGQNLYEEVNLIIKGGDYGWSLREGFHAFDLGPGRDQRPPDFRPLDPIFEYPRTTGLSVTGGIVYRGTKFPEFAGAYVFADYSFGRIIALREKGGCWEPEIIAVEGGIAGIGIDPRDSEPLFANLATGAVMRLARRKS